MSNLLQAEFMKLRRNKIFISLAGLAIIGAVSYIILLYLASRNVIYIDFSNGLTILKPQPGQNISITGIEAFTQTAMNNPQTLLFVLSIFAGFFISNDYGSGAFKNAIINGNSRISIYVAKLIAYITGIYIFMTLFTLISTVGASAILGIGETANGDIVFYMIRSYSLYLLQLGSFAAIIAMLAFFVEESGKSITLCIVTFIGVLAILDLSSRYIPFIEKLFPYTFFYQLFIVFNETMSAWDIGKAFIAGMSGILFTLLIGLHFFTRKELK